jgi:hypothetical protein
MASKYAGTSLKVSRAVVIYVVSIQLPLGVSQATPWKKGVLVMIQTSLALSANLVTSQKVESDGSWNYA